MSKVKHNIIYIGLTKDRYIKIGVTQQTPRARTMGADYEIHYYYDAGEGISTRKALFWAERMLRDYMSRYYPRHQTRIDCFKLTDSDFYVRFFDCINRLQQINPSILPFGEAIEYNEQEEYWNDFCERHGLVGW
jgi:hypothetical protein